MRDARHDPEIHGECGLGGSQDLDTVQVDSSIIAPNYVKALHRMASTILNNLEPVTLVCFRFCVCICV